MNTSKGRSQYMFINNFRSYSNLRITHTENKVEADSGKGIDLKIKLEALPEDAKHIDVSSNKDYKAIITYSFFHHGDYVDETFTDFTITNDMINSGKEYTLHIYPPKKSGDYVMYLAIRSGWLPPSMSSDKIKVVVK